MTKYQLLLAPGPSPTPSEFAWAKAAHLPHIGVAGGYAVLVLILVALVAAGVKLLVRQERF